MPFLILLLLYKLTLNTKFTGKYRSEGNIGHLITSLQYFKIKIYYNYVLLYFTMDQLLKY